MASDDLNPVPRLDENNVPWCQEDCPAFDGKRCKLTGFRPHGMCEPAVIELANHVQLRGYIEARIESHKAAMAVIAAAGLASPEYVARLTELRALLAHVEKMEKSDG